MREFAFPWDVPDLVWVRREKGVAQARAGVPAQSRIVARSPHAGQPAGFQARQEPRISTVEQAGTRIATPRESRTGLPAGVVPDNENRRFA
jgi:hypothetical protein